MFFYRGLSHSLYVPGVIRVLLPIPTEDGANRLGSCIPVRFSRTGRLSCSRNACECWTKAFIYKPTYFAGTASLRKVAIGRHLNFPRSHLPVCSRGAANLFSRWSTINGNVFGSRAKLATGVANRSARCSGTDFLPSFFTGSAVVESSYYVQPPLRLQLRGNRKWRLRPQKSNTEP